MKKTAGSFRFPHSCPILDETSSAIQSHWIKIPGGMIHYRAVSAAPVKFPAVFLIHGLIVSSAYMVPTAAHLAPLCGVYAPDLPGHGKSYKPDKVLALSELADALADWMDALGTTKAHLVGNSMGCQIIAEFALRYPRRIDRLVLQGPTVDPSARSLGQQLCRLIINSSREQRSMGWITWNDYRAAGWKRIRGTIKLALEDRIEDKLPLIKAPTLVVRGQRDALVPQLWAERVTALLPNGKLHVIADAAHTVNYSMPERFAAAIVPFLGLR